MELTKKDLQFIFGGTLSGAGSGAPKLPPREKQAVKHLKEELSLTGPIAIVEPLKP